MLSSSRSCTATGLGRTSEGFIVRGSNDNLTAARWSEAANYSCRSSWALLRKKMVGGIIHHASTHYGHSILCVLSLPRVTEQNIYIYHGFRCFHVLSLDLLTYSSGPSFGLLTCDPQNNELGQSSSDIGCDRGNQCTT